MGIQWKILITSDLFQRELWGSKRIDFTLEKMVQFGQCWRKKVAFFQNKKAFIITYIATALFFFRKNQGEHSVGISKLVRNLLCRISSRKGIQWHISQHYITPKGITKKITKWVPISALITEKYFVHRGFLINGSEWPFFKQDRNAENTNPRGNLRKRSTEETCQSHSLVWCLLFQIEIQ